MSTIPIYWVAILASLVQIVGYADYLLQSKRAGASPNPAGWGMWAFGSATHLWAYSQVTEGWEQDLLPAICSGTCVLVFLYLLVKGKFKRSAGVSLWEKTTFWADVGITFLFGANVFSAAWAALALQFDDLLTYLPTIRDLRKDAQSEHPRPWVLWGIGYSLQGWVVASSGGGLVEWSYPLINLPLCFIVAWMSSKK